MVPPADREPPPRRRGLRTQPITPGGAGHSPVPVDETTAAEVVDTDRRGSGSAGARSAGQARTRADLRSVRRCWPRTVPTPTSRRVTAAVKPIDDHWTPACWGSNASSLMREERIEAQTAGIVHEAETREEIEMMTIAPAAIARGATCQTMMTTRPATRADGGPM